MYFQITFFFNCVCSNCETCFGVFEKQKIVLENNYPTLAYFLIIKIRVCLVAIFENHFLILKTKKILKTYNIFEEGGAFCFLCSQKTIFLKIIKRYFYYFLLFKKQIVFSSKLFIYLFIFFACVFPQQLLCLLVSSPMKSFSIGNKFQFYLITTPSPPSPFFFLYLFVFDIQYLRKNGSPKSSLSHRLLNTSQRRIAGSPKSFRQLVFLRKLLKLMSVHIDTKIIICLKKL